MIRKLLTLVTLLFTTFELSAQQQPSHKLPTDLISFFAAKWEGAGEFANGRKIEADLVFSLPLDSAWLSCSHTDRSPNKYKTTLMWGVDKTTGRFLAYNFDNYQGHRQFESDGWIDNKLVLSNSQNAPGIGIVYEHFIYQKITNDSFKMTYETSRDGQSWKMIDYLVFKRKS
jgi:hypothetical protein